MKNYYEVLGLSPEASQAEIKKAYFKLVRKHSPEKDPEAFQEIREAYEYLKDHPEDEEPVFPVPKDPLAAMMLKHITKLQKTDDPETYRKACEEAVYNFPEELQFQFQLGIAQRRAGNTGKAVKTFENLVKKEPDNKWFQRELAKSYQERGYTRKAIPAFEKAMEMGCRDTDFILCASIAYQDVYKYKMAQALLQDLLNTKQKWNRDEMPELMDVVSGMLSLSQKTGRRTSECIRLFKDTLKQYSLYLNDYPEFVIAASMLLMLMEIPDDAKQDVKEIVQILTDNFHSEAVLEALPHIQSGLLISRLSDDSRLGDTLKEAAQAYLTMDENDEVYTYTILDLKLCMLKEREELIPQLEILEQDYPEVYEKFGSFADRLRSDKPLDHLKDSMQRQYAALDRYSEGGKYFELYPEERIRSSGRVVYQDEENRPYINPHKKVGRNDPCPCGSGKKYKHCCMGKEKS